MYQHKHTHGRRKCWWWKVQIRLYACVVTHWFYSDLIPYQKKKKKKFTNAIVNRIRVKFLFGGWNAPKVMNRLLNSCVLVSLCVRVCVCLYECQSVYVECWGGFRSFVQCDKFSPALSPSLTCCLSLHHGVAVMLRFSCICDCIQTKLSAIHCRVECVPSTLTV